MREEIIQLAVKVLCSNKFGKLLVNRRGQFLSLLFFVEVESLLLFYKIEKHALQSF